MSKAFTRESDDDDASELPALPRPSASLPEGAKNYITPGGAERLRAELAAMLGRRPALASASTAASEAKRQLRALDQQIYELEQCLASAEVTGPPPKPHDRVRFGATVSVRARRSGEESRYRIVGVDEADFDNGSVSWVSPIARALLNAELGGRVRFRYPSGEEELEITAIRYD